MWRNAIKFWTLISIELLGLSACQDSDVSTTVISGAITERPEMLTVDCFMFSPADEEHQRPDYGKNCGTMDSTDLVTFTEEFLALKPSMGHNNLGCTGLSSTGENGETVYHGDYFFTRDGIGRGHDEGFDWGCEPYNYKGGGLLKTYIDGRLAYHDDDMNIVKQTDYVFGNNFENGKTIVCTKRPVKKWGIYFEHPAWAGGICGEINDRFEIMTPITRPYEFFHPLPAYTYEGYMLSSTIITHPGKAEELKAILDAASQDMPGNRTYKTYTSEYSPDVVSITETWDHKDDHLASLKLPRVKEAMRAGRPLIKSFKRDIEHEHYDSNPFISAENMTVHEAEGLKAQFERYAINNDACEQEYLTDYKNRVMHYCDLKNRDVENLRELCETTMEQSVNGGVYKRALERCGHL